MTRQDLRDMIRVAAEIPGDATYDSAINQYLSKCLEQYCALYRFPQLFVPDTSLTVTSSGIVSLASLQFQHIDTDRIFYNRDITDTNEENYNLRSWSRFFNRTSGDPYMFRTKATSSASTAIVIEITPVEEIDTANGRVFIDYWVKPSWTTDSSECPITQLEQTLTFKVAALICKMDTKLKVSLLAQANEAWKSVLSTNLGNLTP